ncbi:MAG: metallophosphoesterase [Bacteroidales bacterium]|nr:metallophosphoesterase [Bacteroidales bacterium]
MSLSSALRKTLLPLCTAVLALACTACRDDSTRFIYFTDTHFPDSDPEQPALFEPICRAEGIPYVIWGGDAVARYADPDSAWAMQSQIEEQISRFASVYNIRGNHDFSRRVRPGEEGTGTTLNQIETAERLKAFRPGAAVTNEADSGACYYFFDDGKARVRYLILDTHDKVTDENKAMSTRYGVGKVQRQWVCDEAIGTLKPGWSLLLFSHAPIWWPGYDQHYEKSFPMIREAAKARGVPILFCMAGHIHRDTQLAQDGLWEITTYCYTPTFARVQMFDTEPATREGTDRPCFEVATLEKGHKILNLRRVGAGHSRSFHLQPIVLQAGAKARIRPRLKEVERWETLDAYDISLSHEEWAYNNRFISFDPATHTVTGIQAGEAMVVAIAPDGARESFLIQVKQ